MSDRFLSVGVLAGWISWSSAICSSITSLKYLEDNQPRLAFYKELYPLPIFNYPCLCLSRAAGQLKRSFGYARDYLYTRQSTAKPLVFRPKWQSYRLIFPRHTMCVDCQWHIGSCRETMLQMKSGTQNPLSCFRHFARGLLARASF